MLVLVFNAGSNSLKFDLIVAEQGQERPTMGRKQLSGSVEDLGAEAVLSYGAGEKKQRQVLNIPSYADAAGHALEAVRSLVGQKFYPALVAHRVVHGGDQFSAPAPVDDHVIAGIERWEELAPLHNAPALEVIRRLQEHLKDVPAVAVFDTAFHHGLPAPAYTYALPLEIAGELQIRRYGFHGISHQYQLLRYAELNHVPPERVKLITLHLESGSSAAAIRDGHSVDTSMGFTPLEGLVMGSRCGDLDPAIVPYMARKLGMALDEVEELLNKKSGLLGLSGIANDTRVLVRKIDDPRARLALEVFSYRVRKYVGAYLAVLDGADAVVFSGGIGENTPFVRSYVCAGLRSHGLEFNEQFNASVLEGDVRISGPSARLHAWVVRSEEALMIAHEAVNCRKTH